MRYRFGDTILDTDSYELKRRGVVQKVEPMVFDLIVHLVANPQRVFSRDELIQSVWKGRIVSDSTVATCIKSARKALGDDGRQQNSIETVRNRGFRFVADVASEPQNDGSRQVPPDSDVWQPSLLILPFECLTDDGEHRALASQLTVELGTILTRVPLLRISDEGARYSEKHPPPTAKRVHRECGVDYVVEGTLQNRDARIDVNALLVDAKDGFRLWSEIFVFERQGNESVSLATAVVNKLEPQIYLAIYKAIQVSDDALSAELLFLKAHSLLVAQGWHHDSFAEAIALLKRIVELEPDFALAQATLSLLIGFGARVGLDSDADAARELVTKSADRALRLDSMDSTVLGYVGCSLADVGEVERGEALLRNALDLNPSNAQAMVALGAVRIAQKDISEAIRLLSKGIEISPIDPRLSIWGALLSVAHLIAGDFRSAVDTAQLACRRNDRTYMPRIALAAAQLASKNLEAAAKAMADAKRIKSDLSAKQIDALVGKNIRNHLINL